MTHSCTPGVRVGKTHTMAGNPTAPGLAPRGVEELFRGSHSTVLACYGHKHALGCVHNMARATQASQPSHLTCDIPPAQC